MSAIWIAAGAAMGAVIRHALTRGNHPRAGLLIANVGGSFVLGSVVLQGLVTRNPPLYLVLGTGFCGTLTTMSGLTLAASERPHGVGTLVLHLLLGVVAAAAVSLGVLILLLLYW